MSDLVYESELGLKWKTHPPTFPHSSTFTAESNYSRQIKGFRRPMYVDKRESCCLATWRKGWWGDAAGAYLSFLRSPAGTGLTEILGRVVMELWDWLEVKDDVSRLRGDRGGVMRLGLLHSEWDSDPDQQHSGNVRPQINTQSLEDNILKDNIQYISF